MEKWALPMGWGWRILAEVSDINPTRPRIVRSDGELTSFVPMQAVDEEQGTIAAMQARPYGDIKRGYTYFEEGDVLLAKITPSMENGKAAIATGLIDRFGFGTTEFHVFRPQAGIAPEWLFHFLRRQPFRAEAKASFRGAVGQQRVPEDFLVQYPIPIPYPNDPTRSLAEQRRIVARLEALLGEVRELRQLQAEIEADVGRLMEAVLAEVFGVLNVPTKPLESVATEIYRYPTFYGLNQVTSGVPVVRGEHIKYDGRLITDWQEYWYISQDTSNQFPRTVLTPGDLVCTVRGTIGKIGLIEESHRNANLSPNLIRISPDRTQIAPRYLWWYLRSPFGQADIKGRSDAAVISTIKASTLKQAPIPTPNELFVQTQIAEHLDRVFQEINEMGVICRDDKLSLDSFEQSILDQAFRGEL